MTRPAGGAARTLLRRAETAAAALALGISSGACAGTDPAQPAISESASATIEIVDQLSKAAPGSLGPSAVAAMFGVKLSRDDRPGFGEKYTGGPTARGLHLVLFVLPDGELRLEITQLQHQMIDQWRAQLPRRGWKAESPIRHPFQMDSFRRDGRQIRLEYNSAGILSVVLFGLNIPRSE